MKITLLDIFRAVDSLDDSIFSFHESPNPDCPVGGNIHGVLDGHLSGAQSALENYLGKVRLSDVTADLGAKIKRQ